jgi:hypothetical protein
MSDDEFMDPHANETKPDIDELLIYIYASAGIEQQSSQRFVKIKCYKYTYLYVTTHKIDIPRPSCRMCVPVRVPIGIVNISPTSHQRSFVARESRAIYFNKSSTDRCPLFSSSRSIYIYTPVH